MRKRKAILHIGTAKTGTTTIQRMLAENREALLARGFCYPRSPGEKNHTRLAIAVARQGRGDKMARATREAGDATFVTDRFAADLAAEMAALPDAVHTCIFSNEHCYRKVDSVQAARRLKALLDRHFDEYRIIVYLRRQDEMAVSVYSTRLRSGAAHEAVLPPVAGNEAYLRRLDWHALAERWAAAFGREAVQPRLFGREEFVEGDLLRDFCAACGIEPAGLAFPEVKNSALSAPAQELLRRLNRLMFGEEGGDDAKAPQIVRQFLDAHFAGRGRRPSRAQAEAFMAHFAASNEALRAAWFPGRERLFPADFSRYPEAPDPVPTDAEVLDVALALIAHQAASVPELQASSAYERAMRRIQAGRPEEARPLLIRTLVKEPGHAGALGALLDIAATAEERAEAAARIASALKAEPGRADLRDLASRGGAMPARRWGDDAAAGGLPRRRGGAGDGLPRRGDDAGDGLPRHGDDAGDGLPRHQPEPAAQREQRKGGRAGQRRRDAEAAAAAAPGLG